MSDWFERSVRARSRLLAAVLLIGCLVPSLVAAQRTRITRVPLPTDFWFGSRAAAGDGRFLVFNRQLPGENAVELMVLDRLTNQSTVLGLAATGAFSYTSSQALSDDGRFLVFVSEASTLVANDTNNRRDVFVFDRQSHGFQRINVGTSGQQSAYHAGYAQISGDGRYVIYMGVPDIMPGVTYEGFAQVILHDRTTGQSSIVNRKTNGIPGGAEYAALSRDGRTIVFTTYGVYLPSDTNALPDAYAYNRITGATAHLTVRPDGSQGTCFVTDPAVSGNGRVAGWGEWGDNCVSLLPGDTNGSFDTLVRDRDADADGIFDEPGASRTVRLGESDAGAIGNHGAGLDSISDSGRFVSFTSSSSNLLPPGLDRNNTSDIFLLDLDRDADGVFLEPGDRRLTLISASEDGAPFDNGGGGFGSALAADGRLVLFGSCADDIVPGDPGGCDVFVADRLGWTIRDLITATTVAQTPQADRDGTWVAFASPVATLVPGDTNGVTDVFVRDRRKAMSVPGAVVRVSVSTAAAQAVGGASDQPSISSDGRFVVFRSAAANLVAGDGNGVADIFLHDRDADQDGVFDEAGARTTVRVNVGTGNVAPVGGASETPRISADGRYVVYASLASNLTPGVSSARQVYFYDRINAITLCVSERDGVKANADAVTPAVSNTGRVAFASAASNLSSSDGNGQSDIYATTIAWPYTAPRTLQFVSAAWGGVAPPGASTQPALSPKGRLAFTTTNFYSSGTVNPFTLVYLESYIRFDGSTTDSPYFMIQSVGLLGLPDGHSFAPSLSELGGGNDLVISFTSSGSNLIYQDTNGVDDVFRVKVTTIRGSNAVLEDRSRTSRVSLNLDGSEASVSAGVSSVSTDGTHVEFELSLAGAGSAGAVVAALVGDGKSTGNRSSAEVTGISPRSGPQGGGTIVTLVGTGLGDSELVPTLGSIPLTVVERASDFIRAVTPPGTGTHIAGLNGLPDIGKAVSPLSFTYVPSAVCVVTAGPAQVSVPAAGGSVALTIGDTQNCGWAARADVDWISDQEGQGDGTISLVARPNVDAAPRRGHIALGGAVIEVLQDGGGCGYDLSAPAASVGPDATTVRVLLRTPSGCGWAAVPSQPWLTITGTSAGAGSYELAIAIAENNDAGARDGAVVVGGRQFAITQAGETFSTLTVSHSPGGRVTSQPTGIDCGTSCAASFGQGTLVTLTPIAETGYLFDGWSGACSGQAGCSVTLDVDRSVTALFREAPQTTQTLTITTSGAGAVVSAPAGISCEPDCAETYPTGTTVTLTASAASGWRFASWSGAGCGAVVQMTADRACAAAFERVPTSTYGLTLVFAGSGRGRVTSSPAGLDCTGNCTQAFLADTTIVLTPSPAAGSVFRGWSGDAACVSGAFQLIQAMTCTATFDSTAPGHTLNVAVTGVGRVRSVPAGIDCVGTCSASFSAGTIVRLVATPSPGQSLSAWSGACAGNRACLISMTQAKSVGASFAGGGGLPIQITDVRPRSGLTGGGTKVHITGSGFAQAGPAIGVDAAVSVLFGTTPAIAVEVLSDTEIVAVTGATPAQAGMVTAGVASVVSTTDVSVNVRGSVATQPAAWRNVALDGSQTTDTDGDALPDQYETSYSLDPLVADDQADADGDGATNLQEYQAGTHPQGRYTRYLAEGATGTFFDTRIAIANPLTVPATTLVRFQTPSTVSPSLAITVPGETRRLVYPSTVPTLRSADFGTVVESDVQLAVDRQMFWNPTIYGSHAGTSVDAPSTTWYLAEGATHGRFTLFYLLQNPGTQDAAVRIRYLRPSLPPLERTYTVPARQRRTLAVDEIPELNETDVSAVIESTNGVPIIVERAMYVTSPTGRAFEGGHESAGVTAPSTHWFLAEGATGAFFDTYVLIANPSSSAADVRAEYLLPNGSTVVKTYAVPANSRRTIWVDGEDARLAATSVSTVVESTNGVPIIVERSMWWPGIESVQRDPATFPILWGEAHNSPGSTETGTAWVLADGDTGPAPVYTTTYILIANTSAYAARVRVTLLSEIDLPPLSREYDVPANGRFTVPVGDFFPETQNYGFGGYGSVVESLATTAIPVPAQIVVERAMYSNSADGIFWAAGTNILAMKLR